jgi:hypothetical protein
MDESMGLAAEALRTGSPGRLMRASKVMSASGAAVAAAVELLPRKYASSGWARAASALAGVAFVGGSIGTRFAVFGAGQESAQDPKYTVVPQRERLDQRGAEALDRRHPTEIGSPPAADGPMADGHAPIT